MNFDKNPYIDLFVGDSLREPSEIRFLEEFSSYLQERKYHAIVFANFYAGRLKQQIDFFIVTPKCACVVELKNFSAAIFGDVNGPWELRKDGVTIKKLERNPYHQARDAKYAVSDEMHSLSNSKPDIPTLPNSKKFFTSMESLVCIYPDIPTGSQIAAGDFKAYVKGYPAFLNFLNASENSPGWTKDHWFELAMHLGLRREGDSEGIHLEKCTTLSDSDAYIKRFLDFYGRDLPGLAVTGMAKEGENCDFEGMLALLDSGKHFQVIGPSGLGKTHIIKHLAILSVSAGWAPIFAPVKYFRGNLAKFLDRCVAHLYPSNAANLLKSLSASGRHPYFIFDGVNECPKNHLSSLIETLQGLAIRQKSPMVFTSQLRHDFPSELSGPTIDLNYPTDAQKLDIAAIYMAKSSSSITPLLDVLKTPFEIFLAIKSLREAGERITKYELFNCYCRKCLERGEDSSLAFRILVRVALIMGKRFSTSIPLSEFKRIAETATESVNARPAAIGTASESGLAELAHGSFSFSHEMIQKFFEAEGLLSTDSWTEEIVKPRNFYLADFVLGAQSDVKTAKHVVKLSPFQNLLFNGLHGEYGHAVEKAIQSDLEELFQKAERESEEISFDFREKSSFLTRLRVVGGFEWTSYERSLMGVIGRSFVKKAYFDKILSLVRRTDHNAIGFLERKGFSDKMRHSLKNDLVRLLYVLQSDNDPAVTGIVNGIRLSGFWTKSGDEIEIIPVIESLLLRCDKQSLGSLFLLCELIRRVGAGSGISQLPRFLKHCWDTGVYNLRLDALEAIQSVNQKVDGPIRQEIIDTVNALDWENNIFLSTQILEVLAAYDSIELAVSVEDAINEIQRIIHPSPNIDKEIKELQAASKEWDEVVGSNSQERFYEMEPDQVLNQMAHSAFSKIWEDVFQGVYDEAIERLEKEDLKKFLTMAALGAPPYDTATGTILRRLLELDDPKTLPAFEKWASIPTHEPGNIQAVAESFVLGIIGLARFNDDPPLLERPQRDDEAAWQCYREILFWIHKESLDEMDVRKNCAPSWERLSKRFGRAAVDPLMRIQDRVFYGSIWRRKVKKDLVTFFPLEIKGILETGLQMKSELTSIFGNYDYFKKDHGRFMVNLLKEVGDETSIPILEKFLESTDLGETAAQAVRSIRAKVQD